MDNLYKNSLIIEKILLNELENFKSIGIKYLSESDIKSIFKKINKKIKSKEAEVIKYPKDRLEQKEVFNELFSKLVIKTSDKQPTTIYYVDGDTIYFDQDFSDGLLLLTQN